jgi:hypothetical protein
VNAVEIWTLSALIGAGAAIYGALEAFLDLRALGKIRNGRRLVARQRLFAQAVRTSILVIWLLLGLSLYLGEARVQFTTATAVLVYGNIATTVIALSDAIVGRLLRRGALNSSANVQPAKEEHQ